ncbi:MAG TPA: hypothetical protein VFE06_06905 [Acidobacteriaceae bacterium]|jgi:hypothetical protein|nr:hypothetical protein [Acidobacteriaceae bacterium]
MSAVGQIVAGRHEYGLRAGQKTLYLFFAVVLCAMAALPFAVSAGNPPPAQMLASSALAASGVYMALVALRSCLIIDGTQVRVQGAVRSRDFDLSQVEGFRTYKSRYQSYQVICLKDQALKIPLMKYATDASLDNWFAGLKDLDQQDREQLLQQIDQDEELGATPEQRRGALAAARQINVAAWIVDALAAAAFAFGPAQYRIAAMVVLTLSPIAAAYMLYQQPLLYGMFKAKVDPRADVSPVLMISAFGLLIGAAKVNFISVGLLLPFIVPGALVFLAVFYSSARKNPRFAGTLTGLLFLSALYGWGLAAAVDTVADASVPQAWSVQVLGGHISHGSRSTSYYLKLEPWGPYAAAATQMKVSARMYYATSPGQIICLALHAGALHAPWYEPVPCDNGIQ